MTAARTVTVTRDAGLHARPAREVTDAVAAFDATVTLARDGREARATSPLELTALGADPGTDVTVRADGEDAAAAVDAVAAVLAPDEEGDA